MIRSIFNKSSFQTIVNKNTIIAIFSWGFSFVFFFIYGDKIDLPLFNSLVFYSTILSILANTDIFCANNSIYARNQLKINYKLIIIPFFVFIILAYFSKKSTWITPEYIIALLALPATFVSKKKHLNDSPVDLILLTSIPVSFALGFYIFGIQNSTYLNYLFIVFLFIYVFKNFSLIEILTTGKRVYLNSLNLIISSRLDLIALLLIGSLSLPNTMALFKLVGVCFAFNDIIIGRKIPKLIIENKLTLKFQLIYTILIGFILVSAILFYRFLNIYLDLVDFSLILYFSLGFSMIFSSLALLKISYSKNLKDSYYLILYSLYNVIILFYFVDLNDMIFGISIGNIVLFLFYSLKSFFSFIIRFLKKINTDIVLFCYAFDTSEDFKNHAVYQESSKIYEKIKITNLVIKINHNNKVLGYLMNFCIPVFHLFKYDITLLGQGKCYLILEKNRFIKKRILLLTENTSNIGLPIESRELSNYKSVLPLTSSAKRSWNDYFDENSINLANTLLFYGSTINRSKYNFNVKTKVINWHPIPQKINLFNYDRYSDKIAFIISSGYAIKGLHHIVKLALNYPDKKILIFGSIETETQTAIKKITSNINYYGYTDFFSKKNKIDILGFVFPYAIEGCSSSVINSIFSGFPVLTTVNSGVRDYISNKKIISLNLETMDIRDFINSPDDYLEKNHKFNYDIKLKDFIDDIHNS